MAFAAARASAFARAKRVALLKRARSVTINEFERTDRLEIVASLKKKPNCSFISNLVARQNDNKSPLSGTDILYLTYNYLPFDPPNRPKWRPHWRWWRNWRRRGQASFFETKLFIWITLCFPEVLLHGWESFPRKVARFLSGLHSSSRSWFQGSNSSRTGPQSRAWVPCSSV